MFDCVKYIPLDGAGYLSFGSDVRERFETYKNEEFSPNPNADNAYLLQRYLFHADYHPAECLRVFGQLQSSLEGGRPGGPRPTDRDAIRHSPTVCRFGWKGKPGWTTHSPSRAAGDVLRLGAIDRGARRP